MKEIWKPIKENINYEISNLGRVKSLYVNRIMKPCLKYGYFSATLKELNSKKQFAKFIHRLVAENFIDNVYNKPQVNHKDENKLNNNINNLEWCTCQYNNTYNDRHIKAGIKKRGIPAKNKGVPMSEEQKNKISVTLKLYRKNLLKNNI